jgi:hypothetical protein
MELKKKEEIAKQKRNADKARRLQEKRKLISCGLGDDEEETKIENNDDDGDDDNDNKEENNSNNKKNLFSSSFDVPNFKRKRIDDDSDSTENEKENIKKEKKEKNEGKDNVLQKPAVSKLKGTNKSDEKQEQHTLDESPLLRLKKDPTVRTDFLRDKERYYMIRF